LLWEFPTDSA
jgi:hypothetical protein